MVNIDQIIEESKKDFNKQVKDSVISVLDYDLLENFEEVNNDCDISSKFLSHEGIMKKACEIVLFGMRKKIYDKNSHFHKIEISNISISYKNGTFYGNCRYRGYLDV